MVKVIGKLENSKKDACLYWVKRKNRRNATDCEIMTKYGRSTKSDCEKTCRLLNEAKENIRVWVPGRFDSRYINFYYPSTSKK
jgi:hypothetical protein